MKIPKQLLPQALDLFAAARVHGPHRADLFERKDFQAIGAELRKQQPDLDDWMVLGIALREAAEYLRSST
jgi:hypothetical protein